MGKNPTYYFLLAIGFMIMANPESVVFAIFAFLFASMSGHYGAEKKFLEQNKDK